MRRGCRLLYKRSYRASRGYAAEQAGCLVDSRHRNGSAFQSDAWTAGPSRISCIGLRSQAPTPDLRRSRHLEVDLAPWQALLDRRRTRDASHLHRTESRAFHLVLIRTWTGNRLYPAFHYWGPYSWGPYQPQGFRTPLPQACPDWLRATFSTIYLS